MIRILVADDHPIIRKGVKQILSDNRNMVVTDEASNGYEVLDKVRTANFDVVLLDLSMPGISGMDILKQIKKEKPRLPVLVLSRYPEEQYALPALKAGASGYLPKTSIVDELINALQKVASGKQYISSTLAEELAGQLKDKGQVVSHLTLSDREREIMCSIASGKKIAEIAKELYLSTSTVSTYRARIMKKMRFNTNADIVRYAVDLDLID
jgi:two-component system, NarL family, invasion response regulator UvrY